MSIRRRGRCKKTGIGFSVIPSGFGSINLRKQRCPEAPGIALGFLGPNPGFEGTDELTGRRRWMRR
jgi:hypothetical protein